MPFENYFFSNYQAVRDEDHTIVVAIYAKGDVVVVIAWLLDLQLPLQSVTITTTVVSLNTAYLITWLTLWNICVTNDQEYVLLVVSTSRSFHNS